MPIDWAATGAMLAGIGTVGGSAAIVVAAVLGRKAVEDFRKEKLTEREITHAENILTSAYKLEWATSSIRSPATFGNETRASQEELENHEWFQQLDPELRDRTIQANVFYQRIRSFSDDYDAALAILPVSKAFFGTETEQALRNIVNAKNTVRVYADSYGLDRGQNPEHSRRIEAHIWEGASLDEEDPVQSVMKRSIAVLEGALFPVIRANSNSRTR